jgi:hypothetical protein
MESGRQLGLPEHLRGALDMRHRATKFIDASAIYTALECCRHALPLPKDHPLLQCMYFQCLSNMDWASSNYFAPELCVSEGLLLLIRRGLKWHRSLQCHDYSRLKVHGALQLDFSMDNIELEAWSILYHRYVRLEFCFSMDDLALGVNVPVRTLQRRINLGTLRLAHTVMRQEQNVRLKMTHFAEPSQNFTRVGKLFL